ncbi:AAA family ATPase [Thermoanaerobacter pentosaceus]|uniref:Flp pilus assembly CpaE family ATPase n=1 Tax=Thermoanaerobacter pentosaceus TaxID=694059 RepID=A0ABT9M302_9THEO|nr:AAA family ATPase [Thermoanaerobacter pentosaceus]MDP9750310.1 Flp pilus assembly CpaE family ATPase [Thermoanaerobacter pentosaceus]
MVNLLISNNLKTIEKIKKIEPCDVALSLESAVLKGKQKKYKFIITDGVDASQFFENAITVKEYLKNTVEDREVRIIRQEVVAVWSVKGGAGKTTLVKKLIDTIDKNIRMLVVDFNFQDGGSDLSFMLELPVIPHLGMYLKEKTRESFFESLIRYKTNVSILQAPPKRSFTKNIVLNDVEEIIKFGRSAFDIIVFDLPNMLNEIIDTVLANSTKRIIVSSGLISEAKRIKELEDNFIVVINSSSKGWKVYYKDFECIPMEQIEKIFE